MSLATLWFVLYVVIIAGYVILDGFDLGVGMLSPFIARNDQERRVVLNSIGPIWDGNEVWLVLGGGALFAAFPLVYATVFSGFYLAMMLVLLVLILRTVAIEFRSKRPTEAWRRGWDWFFFGSSLGITVLLGVALGNIVFGVDLGADGEITVDLFRLLNPYSVMVGITAVAMLCLHGSIFLTQKVEGEILDRVKRLMPKLMLVFFVLMTVTIVWTAILGPRVTENFFDRPWMALFPVLALGATLLAWWLIRTARYLAAFLSSAAMIALLMATIASGLYPVMVPSRINAAYDLTVQNSASAPETLTVMLVIALIGLPFVFLYTAGIYFFFRGKVVLDESSY